jgi:Putative prokaryotic signal transducing protein
MAGGDAPIVCPTCAREHPPSERFCERCGMPLVAIASAEGDVVSGRRDTARKIKPEYAEGKLVKVARGGSQPEAEFIAGLLLEEGIPSMLRRSGGADVPDFMAAGARDIMVPESGAQAAREALEYDEKEL